MIFLAQTDTTAGFLSKDFITVDKLLKKAGFQINTYFIHESMMKLF